MTKPGPNDLLSNAIGLRHVEDWRSFGIVWFTVLCLKLRWDTYHPDESWLVTIFCFLWNSTFCWYCATIVHNSIHVPPFRRKLYNDIWQLLLVTTYGYAVSVLIPGHNLSHHKYTQSPKDVMRTTKMRWSWNFINLLLFFPTIFSQVSSQDNAYMAEMYKQGQPIFYQTAREMIWFVFYSACLCYTDPWRYFVVLVGPQFMAKWGIVSINLFQHDGLPEPEEDKYNFSYNFVDPMLNWFTCNNGYHTAHHICPGTHWSKYKKYHEEKVRPHMNPNLDQTSIIWFFIKRFILPGGRVDKNGNPYVLPPKVDDVPWFNPQEVYETYSDGSAKRATKSFKKPVPKIMKRIATFDATN